jgi:hypothetical protein
VESTAQPATPRRFAEPPTTPRTRTPKPRLSLLSSVKQAQPAVPFFPISIENPSAFSPPPAPTLQHGDHSAPAVHHASPPTPTGQTGEQWLGAAERYRGVLQRLAGPEQQIYTMRGCAPILDPQDKIELLNEHDALFAGATQAADDAYLNILVNKVRTKGLLSKASNKQAVGWLHVFYKSLEKSIVQQ